MTAKKYTLTEEHKAQFPAWRDKWVKLRAIKGLPEWMLLDVKEPCVIRHEEHAPIALDPGVYKVRRFQREYDPEQDRRVED